MAVAVQAPFLTSPAYSGTFIPQLWSGKLNAKFYATTVFGEIANTDYEGEISALGDKITINNIPTMTVSDYVIGQNLNYEVPSPNKVDLTIDMAKYFAFNVSDVLEMQAKPPLMSTFSDDAAKQMQITIDRTLLLKHYNSAATANKGATAGLLSAAYNLGTDNTPLVLTTSNILTLITNFSSLLDEQNVPDTDRWLVITPYVRNILMGSPLAQAYVTGDDKSILRNGKIGTVDRFTIYVSNLLPKAAAGFDFSGNVQGGSAKRQAILAGHKTGLTFASQFTKMEHLQNPNDFGQLVRGLNVYGSQVLKPEALAVALVQ